IVVNKKLDKDIFKFLEQHKQSLDDIQQHIYDVIIINRLKNHEVAAMFTSLMRQIMTTEHNAKLLDSLGLDVGKLNPEVLAKIQQILTEEWLAEQGYLDK
ncbi:TPA: hypothetical protein ACQOEQ_001641, partial [Streptococcus pyogenes]